MRSKFDIESKIDPNVFNIIVEDDDTPITKILKSKEVELSTHIINALSDAIDRGDTYVDLARIITPSHYIVLKSEEAFFIDTLETNKNSLIPYEEYEMCAKANKAIEKMKQRLQTKFLEDKTKYLENKKS